MHRRRFLTGAAALATPIVAGCAGDSGGGDETPAGGSSDDTTIEMRNTAFHPEKAEVDAGTTVTWVNEDSYGHDVTSAQFSKGAASWDFKETLSGGESTTHTFDSEGVYEYYCTIHGKGTMCGVVLVGGVSYDGSLPCRSGGGGGGGGGPY